MALPKNTLTLKVSRPGEVDPLEGTWKIRIAAVDGVAVNSATGEGMAGVWEEETYQGLATFELPDNTSADFGPVGGMYVASFFSKETVKGSPNTSAVRFTSNPFDMDADKTFADIKSAVAVDISQSLIDVFEALRTDAQTAAGESASSAAAAATAAAAAQAVGTTNDTIIAGRVADPGSATATALSAAIADALIPGSPSLAPVYVPTMELAGSIHPAPGARTGLASTTHTVTAGDGTSQAQGYTTENIATGVTGTEGAFTITVSDTTTLGTIDGGGSGVWDCAILNGDGRAFTNTVLDVSGGTVTLLKPLPFDVSGGSLASRIDAAGGQHLTTLATTALAQHIAGFSPLVGTRGGILDGQWDTLPAAARTIWAKNTALDTYGPSVVNGVLSQLFGQDPMNIYDASGVYRRPNSTEGGVQVGTHLAGHGAVATFRLGRRPVVVELCTGTENGGVVKTARIRVKVAAPDGTVIYDETRGGSIEWHRIPVVGLESVTVEVTNEAGVGAEAYVQLGQVTVREAGAGGPIRPKKAILLGDSWTQYYGHKLAGDLADALGCVVVPFGKGGTTTDWGIAWLSTALAANPDADTVILHFYTNDLNNNQSSTMTIPDGSTVSMWPNGLTDTQARTRWAAQLATLVTMIQGAGKRPVVVMPGSVNAANQLNGAIRLEQPRLVEWSAADAEFTDDASYLNTVSKRLGVSVLNTTSGKPLWTTGAAATDPWKDATGTTVHTPA